MVWFVSKESETKSRDQAHPTNWKVVQPRLKTDTLNHFGMKAVELIILVIMKHLKLIAKKIKDKRKPETTDAEPRDRPFMKSFAVRGGRSPEVAVSPEINVQFDEPISTWGNEYIETHRGPTYNSHRDTSGDELKENDRQSPSNPEFGAGAHTDTVLASRNLSPIFGTFQDVVDDDGSAKPAGLKRTHSTRRQFIQFPFSAQPQLKLQEDLMFPCEDATPCSSCATLTVEKILKGDTRRSWSSLNTNADLGCKLCNLFRSGLLNALIDKAIIPRVTSSPHYVKVWTSAETRSTIVGLFVDKGRPSLDRMDASCQIGLYTDIGKAISIVLKCNIF